MPLRPGRPEEAGMLPERVDRVRDLCTRWVKEGHTTALCVCVARRGVIVLHEAFGRLRPEEVLPLERSSVFPLSSATKPITATLLMQLAEEGLVGLNRPAREYLPELAGEHKHEILVHHLLTHTSGYAWGLDAPMLLHAAKRLAAGDIPPCPAGRHPIAWEHNQILADAPLVAKPGELMIYTNANYELLGEIVVRVSGRSLESLARERVFGPLGMDDSWYEVPQSAAARVVMRPDGAPLAAPVGAHMPGLNSRELQETPFAGMGGYGTALDLARFDQAFLEGGGRGEARILSPPRREPLARRRL
jgi:CubicO group peptidase (beta-lactamase class C family)